MKPRRTLLRIGTIAGMAVALFQLAGIEGRSFERANRLHRSDRSTEAAALYRARAEGPQSSSTESGTALQYNLGTSLLGSGVREASEPGLRAATGSTDDQVRGRAYLHLDRAMGTMDMDSAHAHALAAVEGNREALRIRPGDEDARWNLAVAQRMLDSISAAARRSGGGVLGSRDLEGRVPTDQLADGDDMLPDAELPTTGESESGASAEGALTLEEAARILAEGAPDAALTLTKLFGHEGRTRWGRRMGDTRRPW